PWPKPFSAHRERPVPAVRLPAPGPEGPRPDHHRRRWLLLRAAAAGADAGDADAVRARAARAGLLRGAAVRPRPDRVSDGDALPVRRDRGADRVPAGAAERAGASRSEPYVADFQQDG